jgi:hypothetical protein
MDVNDDHRITLVAWLLIALAIAGVAEVVVP